MRKGLSALVLVVLCFFVGLVRGEPGDPRGDHSANAGYPRLHNMERLCRFGKCYPPGWKYRFNPYDPYWVCGRPCSGPVEKCCPGVKRLQGEVVVPRKFGQFGFPEKSFSTVIPPCARVEVQVFVYRDEAKGTVTRFGTVPNCWCCGVSERAMWLGCGGRGVDFLTPQQAAYADLYGINWGGHIVPVYDIVDSVACQNDSGGLLFVKELDFKNPEGVKEQRIQKVHYFFIVNYDMYKRWYDSVVWTPEGEPAGVRIEAPYQGAGLGCAKIDDRYCYYCLGSAGDGKCAILSRSEMEALDHTRVAWSGIGGNRLERPWGKANQFKTGRSSVPGPSGLAPSDVGVPYSDPVYHVVRGLANAGSSYATTHALTREVLRRTFSDLGRTYFLFESEKNSLFDFEMLLDAELLEMRTGLAAEEAGEAISSKAAELQQGVRTVWGVTGGYIPYSKRRRTTQSSSSR